MTYETGCVNGSRLKGSFTASVGREFLTQKEADEFLSTIFNHAKSVLRRDDVIISGVFRL